MMLPDNRFPNRRRPIASGVENSPIRFSGLSMLLARLNGLLTVYPTIWMLENANRLNDIAMTMFDSGAVNPTSAIV